MDELTRTQTLSRNTRNHNVVVSKQREMHCKSAKHMSAADDQIFSLDQSDVKTSKDHCNCNCSNCHVGHVSSAVTLNEAAFLSVNLLYSQLVVVREDSNLKVTLPVEIQPPINSAV